MEYLHMRPRPSRWRYALMCFPSAGSSCGGTGELRFLRPTRTVVRPRVRRVQTETSQTSSAELKRNGSASLLPERRLKGRSGFMSRWGWSSLPPCGWRKTTRNIFRFYWNIQTGTDSFRVCSFLPETVQIISDNWHTFDIKMKIFQ